MAHLAAFVFLGFVGKDGDFFGFSGFDDGCRDHRAAHKGRACDQFVTFDDQNFVECDLGAVVLIELLDENLIALGHAVLFTAGLNNSVHG